MQLLIDVADIHNYRERCQTWTKNRMSHLINNAKISPTTATLDRVSTEKALAEFDKSNPYPSIIPQNV